MSGFLERMSPNTLFDDFEAYNPKVELKFKGYDDERPSFPVVRNLNAIFDEEYRIGLKEQYELSQTQAEKEKEELLHKIEEKDNLVKSLKMSFGAKLSSLGLNQKTKALQEDEESPFQEKAERQPFKNITNLQNQPTANTSVGNNQSSERRQRRVPIPKAPTRQDKEKDHILSDTSRPYANCLENHSKLLMKAYHTQRNANEKMSRSMDMRNRTERAVNLSLGSACQRDLSMDGNQTQPTFKEFMEHAKEKSIFKALKTKRSSNLNNSRVFQPADVPLFTTEKYECDPESSKYKKLKSFLADNGGDLKLGTNRSINPDNISTNRMDSSRRNRNLSTGQEYLPVRSILGEPFKGSGNSLKETSGTLRTNLSLHGDFHGDHSSTSRLKHITSFKERYDRQANKPVVPISEENIWKRNKFNKSTTVGVKRKLFNGSLGPTDFENNFLNFSNIETSARELNFSCLGLNSTLFNVPNLQSKRGLLQQPHSTPSNGLFYHAKNRPKQSLKSQSKNENESTFICFNDHQSSSNRVKLNMSVLSGYNNTSTNVVGRGNKTMRQRGQLSSQRQKGGSFCFKSHRELSSKPENLAENKPTQGVHLYMPRELVLKIKQINSVRKGHN